MGGVPKDPSLNIILLVDFMNLNFEDVMNTSSTEGAQPKKVLKHYRIKWFDDFFKDIKYGLRDPATNKSWLETHKTLTEDDFDKYWRRATSYETSQSKVGICYDFVIAQASMIARSMMNFEIYYMRPVKYDAKKDPCHTFMIVKEHRIPNWVWPEYAWEPFKTNKFTSESQDEMLTWIGTAFANSTGKTIEIRKIQYTEYPKAGVTIKQFDDECAKKAVVKTVEPEAKASTEGLWEHIKDMVTGWFTKPMEITVSKGLFEGGLLNFDPVIDSGNYVIIKNFPYAWFRKAIKKEYGSMKLLNMFETVGMSFFENSKSIRIHKFFLPEIVYILNNARGGYGSQRLIDNIVAYTWLRDLYDTSRVKSSVNLDLVKRDMNVDLFDWQKEFIELYDIKRQQAHLRGELLSFGCGLGKTITSLALMKALNCDGIVVIAPKSTLKDVWVYHLNQFYKKPPKYYLVNETPPQDAEVFVFNYESMDKVDEVMKFIKAKKNVGIIVDESHNFLKMKSLRTQNLIKLREDLNCQHTLLMSGTPLKAIGLEMLPLLRVIDSFFDEEAEAIFRKAFGLNTTLGTDILHSRMNLIMHRRKMEEVFTLPEKTEEILEIKIKNGEHYTIQNVKKLLMAYMEDRIKFHKERMPVYEKEWETCMKFFNENKTIASSPEWKRYCEMLKYLKKHGYQRFDKFIVAEVNWGNSYEKDVLIPALPKNLKDQFLDCKSAIKYLNMKIQGEVLGYLEHLRGEMITALLQGVNFEEIIEGSLKKVIFFTSYVETVEMLDKILKEKGYKSILVYGKTSNRTPELLEKFRKDRNIRVLIATMQTLATGVTLTEANTVVFLNDPWRDADKTQASNRVWRIGQDTPCHEFTLHLFTSGYVNLSDRTANILDWSRRMTDALVGE